MMKMIITDLDGTLLNGLHTLDRRILKTIDKALKDNIYVVIATGRSMSHEVGIDFGNRPLYYISNNGSTIRDWQGNILYEQEISKEFIRGLLKQFPEVPFNFVSRDRIWVNTNQEEYLKSFNTEKKLHQIVLRSLHRKRNSKIKRFNQGIEEIVSQPILKVNCRLFDTSLRQQFEAFIKTFPEVINQPFADTIYEFNDIEATKGNAAMFLIKHLNIHPDEVVVFGDGGNDVSLLKLFKHSYAPANATPACKAVANHHIGYSWTYSVVRQIDRLLKNNQ